MSSGTSQASSAATNADARALPGTPAPAPVAGNCPTTTTAARIGGATACLAAGEVCAKANRDEYPAYGFLCLPQSTEYVLYKK